MQTQEKDSSNGKQRCFAYTHLVIDLGVLSNQIGSLSLGQNYIVHPSCVNRKKIAGVNSLFISVSANRVWNKTIPKQRKEYYGSLACVPSR